MFWSKKKLQEANRRINRARIAKAAASAGLLLMGVEWIRESIFDNLDELLEELDKTEG